jgi:hypothetical protein
VGPLVLVELGGDAQALGVGGHRDLPTRRR